MTKHTSSLPSLPLRRATYVRSPAHSPLLTSPQINPLPREIVAADAHAQKTNAAYDPAIRLRRFRQDFAFDKTKYQAYLARKVRLPTPLPHLIHSPPTRHTTSQSTSTTAAKTTSRPRRISPARRAARARCLSASGCSRGMPRRCVRRRHPKRTTRAWANDGWRSEDEKSMAPAGNAACIVSCKFCISSIYSLDDSDFHTCSGYQIVTFFCRCR